MTLAVKLDIENEVRRAEARIGALRRETPLDRSDLLSDMHGCKCLVKLENLQHTGSFKVRGALNKLIALQHRDEAKKVVTASTGNHGAAVAYAARATDMEAVVFVPRAASATKVEAIRRLGAEIQVFGDDPVEAEERARAYAEAKRLPYVSPYNDRRVIGGQGTIAVELKRQTGRIDAVFAAVGGGGLITGIAGYLRPKFPEAEFIGCSPINSPVMYKSVQSGRVVKMHSQPTLSDGTAGGVEQGSITYKPCRDLVDDWVLVSEQEIQEAMRLFMDAHHMMIEGAAGTAIAAFIKAGRRFARANVVIIICGGNIELETLKSIL